MNIRSHKSFVHSWLIAIAFLAFAGAARAQADKVNTAPLRDFAKSVQARIDSKQLDIKQPFGVEMDAFITQDGKVDRERSKFTAESGDPKMVAVAKEAIMAAGESGYLGYARQAGIEHGRINVSQTKETFEANIFGEQNGFRARMTASGLGLLLTMAASNERMGPNEKLIIQNTRASAGDGGVNITCTLPAADFQRMILGNATAAAPAN